MHAYIYMYMYLYIYMYIYISAFVCATVCDREIKIGPPILCRVRAARIPRYDVDVLDMCVYNTVVQRC